MSKKLAEIRNEALKSIKVSMGVLRRLEMVDIDEGSSPIVNEDRFDSNLTTTLDSIVFGDDGHLTFYHSSSIENGWLAENEISTDALVEIAEYLEDNRDIIQQIIEETNADEEEHERYKENMYNEVSRALTNYEHPQEAGLTEAEAAQGLYHILTTIQNEWVELVSNK